MPLGEGETAAGFEIVFKRNGFFFRIKSNVCFDFPGTEFCRMRDIAFVVFFQAFPQVRSMTDITLIRMIDAADNVSVKHSFSHILNRTALRRQELPPAHKATEDKFMGSLRTLRCTPLVFAGAKKICGWQPFRLGIV